MSNFSKWELDMRKIKRCIIRNTGIKEFKTVYISSDLAEEIKRTTAIKGEIGVDTTFETVPLKVDRELPIGGIVYVW